MKSLRLRIHAEIIVVVGGIIVTEIGGGTAWKYVNGIKYKLQPT